MALALGTAAYIPVKAESSTGGWRRAIVLEAGRDMVILGCSACDLEEAKGESLEVKEKGQRYRILLCQGICRQVTLDATGLEVEAGELPSTKALVRSFLNQEEEQLGYSETSNLEVESAASKTDSRTRGEGTVDERCQREQKIKCLARAKGDAEPKMR
eukprot:TRINITY_DN94170_c0_g1_i1.p1 TRINITY_DN94170_c0_g1~~TRINITY_DN94170_c0_g1_i1.p1  ORF type:complete len:158 (+),score=33.48 TRINITY_DN94170_c0_g1_i1:550-1023(+)